MKETLKYSWNKQFYSSEKERRANRILKVEDTRALPRPQSKCLLRSLLLARKPITSSFIVEDVSYRYLSEPTVNKEFIVNALIIH